MITLFAVSVAFVAGVVVGMLALAFAMVQALWRAL